MALSRITREAVLAAIGEYDRLGQDEFLTRYGFERARSYLLIYDGRTYDSKAIVGTAHGFLPGERPLAASEFSGGEATVGRLLRRLGFTLQVGELTAQGLAALLGKLDVNRPDGIPALDQPVTLLWAISRAFRSEPRKAGRDETRRSVRDLIERFGRSGERPDVHSAVEALRREGLWERDGLVASVYELVRDSAQARDAAVDALVDGYFTATDPAPLLDELGLLGRPAPTAAEAAFADEAVLYKDLCEKADIYWSGERGSRREPSLSARLRRSAAARDAVLLRSRGRCENPRCTGDVQDVTDRGAAILDVDHLRDLAKGGPDDPVQMIALCPNCHATKTRGQTRERLREELLAVAEEVHQKTITRPGPS